MPRTGGQPCRPAAGESLRRLWERSRKGQEEQSEANKKTWILPLDVLAKGTKAEGGVEDATGVWRLGGRRKDCPADRNRECTAELVSGDEDDERRTECGVTAGQAD